MPQTHPTLPQKHPSVFHTATLRYETLQQARSPMCWPTEEVRMSGRTRAACGLVVASLFAASTAAGQGARVQFGVAGSLTVPLGDFHADASGDGFKADGKGWPCSTCGRGKARSGFGWILTTARTAATISSTPISRASWVHRPPPRSNSLGEPPT